MPNVSTQGIPLGVLIMPKMFYEIDTGGQFHTTFSVIIYTHISILPYILTQAMSLGVLIMPKKFYEIDTDGQFHTTFFC